MELTERKRYHKIEKDSSRKEQKGAEKWNNRRRKSGLLPLDW